jgi:para-aminobenzoate synthetase component 1
MRVHPQLNKLPFSPAQVLSYTAQLSREPGFFWFDSNRPDLAEYSYLGWNPLLELSFTSDNQIHIHSNSGLDLNQQTAPLELLDRLTDTYAHNDTSIPFLGGWIVALSYDYAHKIEDLPPVKNETASIMGFYETILIIKHATEEVFLSTSGILANHAQALLNFNNKLMTCQQSLNLNSISTASFAAEKLSAELNSEQYNQKFKTVLNHIQSGDTYQINLSYRLRTKYSGDNFHLYQELRKSNPAPFSAYYHTKELDILSCSPELFLSKRGNSVITKPIKGTRPKLNDPKLDQAQSKELYSSAKERAELTMIVDLERNDLSKIAIPGSVSTSSELKLEPFATVQHLVAKVECRLPDNTKPSELIYATFPGGSITGAPKRKSIEIINAIENSSRGLYTGILGFFSLNGCADFNILIRTLIAQNQILTIGTGGGIVADSNAELEFQETKTKIAIIEDLIKSSSQPNIQHKLIFLNGHLINAAQNEIEQIANASGVFETICFKDQKLSATDQHLERFKFACLKMGLHFPTEIIIQLDSICQQLAQHNQLSSGALRISLTQADNHCSRTNLLIHVRPNSYTSTQYTQGLNLISRVQERKANDICDIKLSNRSAYAICRKEAQQAGFDDVLFHSDSGQIYEASYSNLFLIKNDVIFTPTMNGLILPGVMQKQVARFCLKHNISFQEADLNICNLTEFEGCFLTNVIMRVMPVRSINQLRFDPNHSLLRKLLTL